MAGRMVGKMVESWDGRKVALKGCLSIAWMVEMSAACLAYSTAAKRVSWTAEQKECTWAACLAADSAAMRVEVKAEKKAMHLVAR